MATSIRSQFLTVAAVVGAIAAGGLAMSGGRVGAAGEFTMSPTTLSFPTIFVGETASIAVTVTNVSGASQTPNFAGGAPNDPTNFGGSQDCAGKTFAPGDTCSFTYSFEPASPGTWSSSTTVTIGSDNFAISMSGTAEFPFTVAPTTLAFPDTAVGATSSIPVTIANISSAAQTPNFAGGAPIDPTHFGGSQNCAGKTFAPGDSCEFTYTFSPVAIGPWSTTTTIDVDGESFAISMSGTGTDPTATTTTTTTTTTDTTTTTEPSTTATTTTAPGTATTLTTAPATTIAGVFPAVPGPVDPHSGAMVIAQGVVDFPAQPVQWEHGELIPSAWPFQFTDLPASFLVDEGPDAVLVTVGARSVALLDGGEAVFVPAGSTGSATPMFNGAAAAGHRITFVAGSSPEAFSPGAGRRDVNLVRALLQPGESVTVTSPFPLLAIVVDGTVADALGGNAPLVEDTVLQLGATAELHNDGAEPATVLVAAVGGQVP